MAGGISVHVVDVTRGLPAVGMKVEIFSISEPAQPIAAGVLSGKGLLDHPIVEGKGCDRGVYEVVFYIGDFYRQLGYSFPDTPFLDVVPFRFGIGDVEQHYHLPLKVSPWGFSLFRGG
ncbi:MAG TPA: hydroxyisourate hydrolase [Trichocoleus sp.]|jgi:5-hydroxyisourate hydrolase